MTTVVIEQAEVRLTPNQLVAALRQLSAEELESVFRELEVPSWSARFGALLQSVREQAAKYPISDEEIDAEVETVREQSYKARS
jgi:hypothetical protein